MSNDPKTVRFINGKCLGMIDGKIVDAYPGDIHTLPARQANAYLQQGDVELVEDEEAASTGRGRRRAATAPEG